MIITVSNTGEGIDEEDITKVFDRYKILDNFENQDKPNMWSRNGLGLAISYSMVSLLDGTINIKSTPNEWTSFIVELPVLTADNKIVDVDYNIEQVGKQYIRNNEELDLKLPEYNIDESKPTILIIDDEPEVLWFMCDIFSDKFNIIPLKSAVEGLNVLEEVHPDIIICDVVIPELDGIWFTKHVKSNSKTLHIPIILVSSKHEVEEQIEGINAGAELYVTKPFNVDYLISFVLRLLNRKETLKDYFTSPISAFEMSNGKLTHKEHRKILKNIIDIINKNINDPLLSANFIAEKMNMSSRNLYRKTNEIGNISISDMIRDCRLIVAEDLLLKSKLTIGEIVFKSGFSNRVSFFKAFAKKHGCTPKEFRSNNL